MASFMKFISPELKRILKELFPVMFLCVVGGVLAGLILNTMEADIKRIPGLLVLLPAVLAMRGNISGAIGSRLGSALHLGLIEPDLKWNKTLSDNVCASLILNVVMSLVLGIIAHYTSVAFGFESAGVVTLTLISLIAGTVAGVVLTGLSVFIAITSYAMGLDPDNVVNPLLLTSGDILTVICLLFAAKLF
ncbi:hypothetical protein BEH94_07410 [Candidatus Altiarchaeales archaeon WOR_SM1_SCG]|nr:hypothetical protein BEH94_07410 [Candidatus Altiarchaeales archaeon WOR_SM1_SCG]